MIRGLHLEVIGAIFDERKVQPMFRIQISERKHHLQPLIAIPLELSETAGKYSEQIQSISLAFRATCYLSTAQIFLQSNGSLSRPLEKEDVKPRLLGHFVRFALRYSFS